MVTCNTIIYLEVYNSIINNSLYYPRYVIESFLIKNSITFQDIEDTSFLYVTHEGLFRLDSDAAVGISGAYVGSDLRFATSRGAEYVKTTFEILLRQWFDPDSIK